LNTNENLSRIAAPGLLAQCRVAGSLMQRCYAFASAPCLGPKSLSALDALKIFIGIVAEWTT